MATVYLARDLRHDRPVALKLLHPELAATLGPERFQREIRLTARLDHPHILPVLDSGTAAGQLWYTMPYVRGESLRDRLRRESQLPVELALEITRQVASALDYAHREGVVHRDLKPENILLSEEQARVADFGVAKALALDGEELTETGLAVGTPAYMSPEQATGGAVDARTDVYALGCVWYEMLAGDPPFLRRTPHALLAAQATETPEPISKRRPSVPPQLAALADALPGEESRRPSADSRSAPRQAGHDHDTQAGARRSPPAAEEVASRAVASLEGWHSVSGCSCSPGLLAVFWPRATGAKSLDPNLVAVVPFRIAGADPSLAYLREGMLDLLGAKLTGDGGPRAADPRSVMSIWRRQVGDEHRDLPQDSAMLLARQLGAGRLLLGGIVGTQDRLVINASLLEVPGGGARAAASVAGEVRQPGSPDRPAHQRAARARGGRGNPTSGRPHEHLASGASGLPPGPGSLSCGAATGRRSSGSAGRWSRIPPSRSRRSGLVFAGTWEAPETFDRAIRLASRLRERLSPRDRVLLAAFAGPHYPAPYPFVEQLAGWQRAAEVLWDSPETWYQLADVLFHRVPVTDVRVAASALAAAFRRAIELDSTFAAPLDHLVEIAVLTGDTAEVRRLGDLYLARYPEAELTDFVRWRMTVVLGSDSARAQLRSRFDQMNVRSLVRIVAFAQLSGIGLEDVEAASAALRREAAPGRLIRKAPLGPSPIWRFNQGRPSEAREALEATREFGPAHQVLWNHVFYALFGEGDSTMAVNAVRRLLPVAIQDRLHQPGRSRRAEHGPLHPRALACPAGASGGAHSGRWHGCGSRAYRKKSSPRGHPARSAPP